MPHTRYGRPIREMNPAPQRAQLAEAASARSASLRNLAPAVIQRAMRAPRALTSADVRQLQRTIGNAAVGRQLARAEPRPNRTRMPDGLKAGIESLSGMSMDGIKIYYNSPRPAQLNALAYTQGTDIHVAPGKEKHLPHEAWHVVQQAQGRVAPSTQLSGGIPINDDEGLEREADVMGAKALGSAVQLQGPRQLELLQAKLGPVQRRVGFEAELRVPSLGPPKGELKYNKQYESKVTDSIRSFLDGGVPYQTDIGKGETIRLDADHSSKVSRIDIVDKLKKLGYVSGIPSEPETNLEFVTTAYDELAAGSNKTFNELFKKLKEQLQGALDNAKSEKLVQLGPPAEKGYKTGVPVQDLKDWMFWDDEYDDELKPLVDKFLQEQTADEIYLQATVGIIPSGIRTFLGRVTTPNKVAVEPPSEARQKVLGIVTEIVSELESWKPFAEHVWVKALDPVSRESLLGLLSLAYTYLLGDVLQQTTGGSSSVVKNAVPFLIKSSPYALVAKAAPTMLKSNPVPVDLARLLGERFKDTRYLRPAYWIETGATSAKGQGLLQEPVEARPGSDRLITGDYGDFVEQLLRGTGQAKLSVVTGKMLPGADPLPKATGDVKVSWESFDQAGIPLEYRWIRDRYTIGSLVPALREIITDVRQANMRELTEEQRQKVETAIKS